MSNINNEKNKLLSVRGISKSFGGIQALKNVSLDVKDKEILALLGDNGAGKSTLIKTISGAHMPDEGEIYLEGKKTNIKSPEDAKRLGIKTVYQDLALFGILDVTSNLFAGDELTKWGFLQRKKMKQRSIEVLKNINISVKSLSQEVRRLSGGQQHAVAIARGVYIGAKPKLVIMDEPTAGLGVEESQRVLDLLLELKKDTSIIYITHNMNYAFKVADRTTILHSGEVAGSVKMSDTSEEEIIGLMMGSKVR